MLTFAMVETAAGLANVEAIVATPAWTASYRPVGPCRCRWVGRRAEIPTRRP